MEDPPFRLCKAEEEEEEEAGAGIETTPLGDWEACCCCGLCVDVGVDNGVLSLLFFCPFSLEGLQEEPPELAALEDLSSFLLLPLPLGKKELNLSPLDEEEDEEELLGGVATQACCCCCGCCC